MYLLFELSTSLMSSAISDHHGIDVIGIPPAPSRGPLCGSIIISQYRHRYLSFTIDSSGIEKTFRNAIQLSRYVRGKPLSLTLAHFFALLSQIFFKNFSFFLKFYFFLRLMSFEEYQLTDLILALFWEYQIKKVRQSAIFHQN